MDEALAHFTEGDFTEITSGLAAGDGVVIDGVDKLQEGSKVVATTAQQPDTTAPRKRS